MLLENTTSQKLKIIVRGIPYVVEPLGQVTIPDRDFDEVQNKTLLEYPQLSVVDPLSGDDGAAGEQDDRITALEASYPKSGSTAQRPAEANLPGTKIGYMFFDTDLGYPVFYKGDDEWVDAAGNVV